MNIFKEAKLSEINGMGYRSRRFFQLWKNKNVNWNWLAVEYGIRWSDKWQIFPVWNVSNNTRRALLFGFWKLYIEINYHRKNSFNQNRKLLFRKKLWKFYQLFS